MAAPDNCYPIYIVLPIRPSHQEEGESNHLRCARIFVETGQKTGALVYIPFCLVVIQTDDLGNRVVFALLDQEVNAVCPECCRGDW
jgi:hypothetical protein